MNAQSRIIHIQNGRAFCGVFNSPCPNLSLVWNGVVWGKWWLSCQFPSTNQREQRGLNLQRCCNLSESCLKDRFQCCPIRSPHIQKHYSLSFRLEEATGSSRYDSWKSQRDCRSTDVWSKRWFSEEYSRTAKSPRGSKGATLRKIETFKTSHVGGVQRGAGGPREEACQEKAWGNV